ncbi:MAG: recombination protein RecR, partial [Firmicutes bacterium]|nr:recombination protein RecR [Bacillota bacterium]
MGYYGDHITRLIEELSKLPCIGGKSAQKLAFYIINMPEENARSLANSITEAKKNIKYCSICQNFSNTDICP